MRRIFCVLLALLSALTLCACDTPTDTPSKTDPTEWQPSAPETYDLSALLTADEVSAAVGQTVTDGVLQEHDTLLLFANADSTLQVSLLLEEAPIRAVDYLESLTANYLEGELSAVEKVGDKAYWCAGSGELLVSYGDYVLSLNVVCESMTDEARLAAARQLVGIVIGRV